MSNKDSPKDGVAAPRFQPPLMRRNRFFLSHLSIKHRLPLLIGILLSGIIVVSIWVAYRGVKASVLAVGRERLLRLTEQLANISQQSFVIQGRRTFSAANDPALQAFLRAPSPATRPGAMAILQQFMGPQDPNGIQVELWSADHTLALALPGDSTPLQADLETEFKQCATEPFRAAGAIRLVKDTLAASVVAMVRDEAGKPYGYLVRWRKTASTPEARKQLADLLGSQAAFYFGNHQGDLWTDTLKVVPPPPVDLRATPNVTRYTRDENPVMAVGRPITGTPWFIVVEFPEQVFLSPATAFLRLLVLIGLVLFVLGMAGAFALSRNITRPLHVLTEAASAISGGDYSRLAGIRQNDELGTLAGAFDAMVIKLHDSQRELERQVQEKTLLLESSPSAMLMVDERGLIVLANNQAQRLFGYTQDELLEQPVETLIPDRYRAIHSSHREGFFQQPSNRSMGAGRDLYGVRKDGSEFPVEIGLNPIETERGVMVLSTIVDITERKRAEGALRESEARFQTLADGSPVLLWVNGLAGCEFVNREYLNFLGLDSADNVGGYDWSQFVHPDDRNDYLASYLRAFEAQTHFSAEFRFRRRDGQYCWMRSEATPRRAADRSFLGFVGASINIAERKQAEESLRKSQEQLAGVIGSAMDAIITIDGEQRIILFNAAAEKMFGCPVHDAMGQSLERFIPAQFRANHQRHIQEFGRTNVTKRTMGSLGAIFGLRSDGEEFPIEASISQLEAEGQRFYTVILRDITERQQSEERLREQAALLNFAHEAIIVRDLDDRIHFWNKGAERIYGWKAEEVVGANIQSYLYRELPPQLEKGKKALLDKGEWIGELVQLTKDGREIVVEAHWALVRDERGEPKSILAINTDIIEKKKLEAQLRRAQRLESIGTLAGGVAHDLNNILSPILMGIHLLQGEDFSEESQRWLKTMRANVLRGSDLIKQVLTFARGSEGQRVKLSPKYLVKDLVQVLQDTLPKSIEVNYSVPNDLWPVIGDATQLYQLLMNLCVNARDAMPDGGRLIIKAENTHLDETYARMRFNVEPGRLVLLTIADNGIGIPPEIREKIFDPFFTTKEIGQGTGLGLSTVLGIVKSHGGLIDVSSQVGQGTTFKVYLPAVETEQMRETEVPESELPVGHGELILLIDDEKSILEIARETLEAHGYTVLTAGSGVEAVALCAEHKGEVQAALVDMMMPLMDGPATIRALRRLEPQLKIIATSGVPGEGKETEAVNAGGEAFLPKPYTAERLLNILAEVLAAKRQGQAI